MTTSPTPISADGTAIYRDDYPGVLLYFGYTPTHATRVVIIPNDGKRPVWAIQHMGMNRRWFTRYFAYSRDELERWLPGKVETLRKHLPELPGAKQYPSKGLMVW